MQNLTARLVDSDYAIFDDSRGGGHGIAYADFDEKSTWKDLIDQWVDEAYAGSNDFHDLPGDIGVGEIEDCIVSALTDRQRADYNDGAVCDYAKNYDDYNNGDDPMDWPVAMVLLDWHNHPDYDE